MRPITDPEKERLPETFFQKTTQKIVPGPDKYEFNQDLHPKGKYFASKFRSSGSKAWNPPSSERFHKSSNF